MIENHSIAPVLILLVCIWALIKLPDLKWPFWVKALLGVATVVCAALIFAREVGESLEYVMKIIPWLHKHSHEWWRSSPWLASLTIGGIVGICGAVAFWTFANDPPKNDDAEAAKAEPKIKTLLDYYKSDFSFMSTDSTAGMGLGRDTPPLLEIKYKVWQDFDTNSKFLSVFVPRSPHSYDVCVALAQACPELVERAGKGIQIKAGRPGDAALADSNDLVFTGKVYVYHEGEFALSQLGKLDELFRSKKLTAQFRGWDYISSQFLLNKVAKP